MMIKMRTTLDIESDVLAAAKSLATARGVSVGAALSELARRGCAAKTPTHERNGLVVFEVPGGTLKFGPDEIARALAEEDAQVASDFLAPKR